MDFNTKTDILVFFANAMDLVGKDGGKIRGCTIHYVFLNNMIGVQSEYDITKPLGMQRGKAWLDYDMRDRVRLAPAIYEGTFTMSVDKDGKPCLKLVDIAYKSNVLFVPCVLPGLEIPGMLSCDAPSREDVMNVLEALKKPAENADNRPGKKAV